MGKIESFEDLVVWQKAHALVLKIYQITKDFPPNEQFGLTSQLRRCIVSVPANISEGSSRYHLKEYLQFINVAKGSIGEGKYYLKFIKEM